MLWAKIESHIMLDFEAKLNLVFQC